LLLYIDTLASIGGVQRPAIDNNDKHSNTRTIRIESGDKGWTHEVDCFHYFEEKDFLTAPQIEAVHFRYLI